MKKNSPIYILGGVVLLLLFLLGVIYIIKNRNANKFNWTENYKNDNKQPYGMQVTYELLDGYFPGYELSTIESPLKEAWKNRDTTRPANYVLIGDDQYMDSTSNHMLAEFVKRGNKAFLSVNYMPVFVQDALYSCHAYDFMQYKLAKQLRLKLYHPDLDDGGSYTFKYANKGEESNTYWTFINPDNCYGNEPYLSIGGSDSGRTNFILIPYGKGEIYVHTTPLAFTNYFMLDSNLLEYAEKTFSHLTEGDIYWDEYHKVWRINADFSGFGKNRYQKGPLSYILDQPALAWAWYILLVIVILYTIFRAKRRQRIIPLITAKRNTSLEFVQTIGQLYYRQNDHRRLALEQYKLFLNYIRSRYNLPTNKIDDKLKKRLAVKSQVAEDKVSRIFKVANEIENVSAISDDRLIGFHKMIEYFYQNSK